MRKLEENCPDCGTTIGKQHFDGCDVERCPECGHQYISCGCGEGEPEPENRIKWSGFWPGVVEAAEYGWYAKFGEDGWVQCDEFDEGAREDLNRVDAECLWDKDKHRFVLDSDI